jgi:hypothetical protein
MQLKVSYPMTPDYTTKTFDAGIGKSRLHGTEQVFYLAANVIS